MSKISIRTATITAPMGMVVSTAKVNSSIQKPTPSRVMSSHNILSSRRRATLRHRKHSVNVESLKPYRERRPKLSKRLTRLTALATS